MLLMTGGVLAGEGLLADVLDATCRRIWCRAEHLVAVVDVGLMVLVVMKLQRLLGHVRAEGVVGIGEFWELERHGDTPLRVLGVRGRRQRT